MNQETKRITEIVEEIRGGNQSNCQELVNLLKKRVIVKVRNVNLYEAEQDEIIDDCVATTLCYAINTWNKGRAASFLTYFYLRCRATIWNKCVVLHNKHQCVRLNSISIEAMEDWKEPGEEDNVVEYNDIVKEISNSLSKEARSVFKGIVQGNRLTTVYPKQVINEIRDNPVVQETASHYTRCKNGRVERVWQ